MMPRIAMGPGLALDPMVPVLTGTLCPTGGAVCHQLAVVSP